MQWALQRLIAQLPLRLSLIHLSLLFGAAPLPPIWSAPPIWSRCTLAYLVNKLAYLVRGLTILRGGYRLFSGCMMEEDDVPSWVPRMSFDRSAYYPDLSEQLSCGYMQYERPLILAFNELMHTCANISLLEDAAALYILAELEYQSASILLNIICGCEDDLYSPKLCLEEAQERWGYLSHLYWFRSSFLWLSDNIRSVRSMYTVLYGVEDGPPDASDAPPTDYYSSSEAEEDDDYEALSVSLSS